jgi:hypothetical protein
MCFSATASFTAGAVLTVAGAASTREVQKPSQRLLGSIPFLFAIQQFAEGLVWLAFTSAAPVISLKAGTYFFLVFSDIVWPIMIPLSVFMVEGPGKRKKAMLALTGLGALLALYYTSCLFIFPVNPELVNCHINYDGTFPKVFEIPAFLIYVSVTIIPLFLSTAKRMRWLGVAMFLACLVSVIFYIQVVTSVWCFFAAVLSAMIVWILRGNRPAAAQ